MTTPTHITTSGGLISAAFIENIREPGSRQRGVEPASFALPWSPAPKSPAALEETIATAWELLLERWDAVRADLPMMDVSQVRSRWLLPLFQLLDFDPIYLRGDTVLDEAGKLRYSLSHRGWPALSPALPVPSPAEGSEVEGNGEGALRPELVEGPVIHTVIPSQNLDGRMAAGRGIKAKSPHDMLQAFLNVSPADLWAVLTNGILLRLLRDYHHTFTKGFVQFDLESIFETRNYGDFRALYRLCHASRFVPQGEGDEAILPLEQFYKDSIATGIKVGEDLRGQVRQAIETLGNGFLDGDLIRRLQTSPLKSGGTEGGQALCHRYYGEILHIIYRILFLLFAEQRGMMPGRDSLYAEAYSIARLRARAEGDIPREDDFTDLWEGLKVTFRLVREGVPDLGVFGYDGMLFEENGTLLEAQGLEPLLAGRACRNSDLLRAIRALTLIEREGVLQRISYADLGVEELGSIYESLLDFTPRVSTGGREIPANAPSTGPSTSSGRSSGRRFFLDPRGSERKTTGSYYTHPSLVNELIKSALLPVARDRLAAAGLPVIEEEAIGEATAGLLTDYADLTDEQRAAGEAALLSIKVCDPAAGSGHFLVKADNALGAELARIRSGDEYPTETQVQAAKRDVLAHCIYAVDVNPMAVELCKVSLWINASVADRPLSFLDHHIKCGNSLIGAMSELMAEGIPTDAFKPVTGDDRTTVNAVRTRNRQELKEWEAGAVQTSFFQVTLYEPGGIVRQEYVTITDLAQAQPRLARERYIAYLAGDERRHRKLEADFWTAAFFWPLTGQKPGFSEKPGFSADFFPTHGEFMRLRTEGPKALPPEALAQIEALAERYRFFHWHLEFPDVYHEGHEREHERHGSLSRPSPASRPSCSGFDVVLGNPPWERIKLQEKEFFADKDPEIANARTAAERRRLIRKLPQTNPALHTAYTVALRESEATGHFLRDSDRFPLTSSGDINYYAVFAGLARQIVAPRGRAGIVVPTGIATDYTNQDFFADLVTTKQLASLYDFENRRKLFPEVDSRYKFSLLTLSGKSITEAKFAFFLHTPDELADPERRFTLTAEDFTLLNPNTRTVPVFRARRDAELTTKIYHTCPVWMDETKAANPWGVNFLRMIDPFGGKWELADFKDKKSLHVGEGRYKCDDDQDYLPVYEGKMIYQHDHRFASVVVNPQNPKRPAQPEPTVESDKLNPSYLVSPQYWVEENAVVSALAELQWDSRWLLVQKKVSSPTNERTHLSAVIPIAGTTESLHCILVSRNLETSAVSCLAANLNTIVLDFAARQKLGGENFNYFVLKQLPILPPDCYTPELLDFIVPHVVELTYTAWDLQPFGQDILDEVGPETWARWFTDAPVHTSTPPEGQPATPAPFIWDEERRAHLRAELDGLYAHLYGLTREELAYILDTFPIVRRKDEERWGEYRTKRLVLESFENYLLKHPCYRRQTNG